MSTVGFAAPRWCVVVTIPMRGNEPQTRFNGNPPTGMVTIPMRGNETNETGGLYNALVGLRSP